MREMICAASLPRPFRITRSGVFLALLALRTIPIAPSAAAKDSWPARKPVSYTHLKANYYEHCCQDKARRRVIAIDDVVISVSANVGIVEIIRINVSVFIPKQFIKSEDVYKRQQSVRALGATSATNTLTT